MPQKIPLPEYRKLVDSWVSAGRAAEIENLSPAFVAAVDSLRRQYTAKSMLSEAVVEYRKHYGPGPHLSGSDQSVHGSRPVPAMQGIGTSRGQSVQRILTDKSGVEVRNSFQALPEGAQKKMLKTASEYGLNTDPAFLDANMARILESARARYKDHPELIDQDRFYENWHESYQALSEEVDVEFSRVITAGAVISPGLDAQSNLHFAHDIARWTSSDLTFEGEDAETIKSIIRSSANDILDPVYGEYHEEVIRGEKRIGDPRTAPKEGSAKWQKAQLMLADADRIDSMGSFSLSDISSVSGAYALHYHRAANGGSGPILGPYSDASGWTRSPNGGFGVTKGYDNYGKAISAIRGFDLDASGNRFDVSPNDVLGDVKVRSFHNNILDPTDAFGRGDVTVDYHTINFAFGVVGAEDENPLHGTPSWKNVSLGVRPIAADAVRRAADSFSDLTDGIGSRAQEIAWAEWKRGLRENRQMGNTVEGVGPRFITHWQPYEGEAIRVRSVKGGRNA